MIARYVEMTAEDNFYSNGGSGPPAGGDRLGLGEVAFEIVLPATDPLIDLPANVSLDLDGSVQSFDIPVSNLGASQSLVISGISFSGAQVAAFSQLSLPAPVAPGANDIIQVIFNPTGLSGNVAANLLVQSTDPDNPTTTVALSGFLHDPKLVVASASGFGPFDPGVGAQPGALAVSNGGGGQSLAFLNTTHRRPDADHFLVITAPGSLPPFAAGTVDLSFNPLGEEGAFAAQLTITSNDAADSTRVVNLTAQVGDLVPNSGVRINEFMASNGQTLNDGDGNSSDWIELHNTSAQTATLDNWQLRDTNNTFTFPANTTLPANAFLVLTTDLAAFTTQFPTVTNVLGDLGSGLSGSGERIELHTPTGLHDFVEYDDSAPWPPGPDGNGTTLELIDATTDNALATSWAESTVLGGTPGEQNSVTP